MIWIKSGSDMRDGGEVLPSCMNNFVGVRRSPCSKTGMFLSDHLS